MGRLINKRSNKKKLGGKKCENNAKNDLKINIFSFISNIFNLIEDYFLVWFKFPSFFNGKCLKSGSGFI